MVRSGEEAAEAAPLVDSFGRIARDLRVSITDRCNFRCVYCMDEEMEFVPREQLLRYEEVARLAAIFVGRLGIESIRLTGGEPTVRRDLDRLVGMLAGLQTWSGSPVELSLTTNGARLDRLAAPLRRAGLARLNISLDTLRRDRFEALTRRDELDAVLAGIDAAVEAGFSPVKLNCVVMRGRNDDELVDLARFGREQGVQVRFIEYMPLDAEGTWTADQVVSAREILTVIGEQFPLEPVGHGSEPAARFRYLDGGGEIGVIPSVTAPFCSDCDRVRLTAEGNFRTCLFSIDEVDLRHPLRSGASDADLAELARAAVADKWAGHKIGRVDFLRPRRSMSQIGG